MDTKDKRVRYQVDAKRDEAMIKAYITFINRVKYPNVSRNFLIAGAVSAAMMIGSKFLWLRIIFLLMALFCVLMGLFRHLIPLSAAKKSDPDYLNGVVTRYQFTDDGAEVSRGDEIVDGDRRHSCIVNFYDDESYYYVNYENGDLIVLPKDKFTAGDEKDFKTFLTERTGKECIWTPATAKNQRIQRSRKNDEQFRKAQENMADKKSR